MSTSINHSAGPMRIALFAPSLRGGGAERSAANLAGGMAARGFRVDMVLVRACGPYLDSLSEDVNVVDLNSSRVLFALPGLVRYLRHSRPHVLISFMDHANIIALMARTISGASTKVIGTVRNDKEAGVRQTRDSKERLVMALTRPVYQRLDRVVAVSHGVARSVAARSGVALDDVRVIYNPVVTARLLDMAVENPKCSWFEDGTPVVVGVGRLSEQKDFETLIRSFADVCSKRPARLIVLGEGGCRGRLERIVRDLGLQEDVLMPGFAANPFSYLSRADVFVLSSRWEGLPGVLIEAMACGCAVVSTDCPSGPDEILNGGDFGILVPVADVGAMSKAIEKTLETPPDTERLRKRAGEFSMDRAVDEYLELCRRMVGG